MAFASARMIREVAVDDAGDDSFALPPNPLAAHVEPPRRNGAATEESAHATFQAQLLAAYDLGRSMKLKNEKRAKRGKVHSIENLLPPDLAAMRWFAVLTDKYPADSPVQCSMSRGIKFDWSSLSGCMAALKPFEGEAPLPPNVSSEAAELLSLRFTAATSASPAAAADTIRAAIVAAPSMVEVRWNEVVAAMATTVAVQPLAKTSIVGAFRAPQASAAKKSKEEEDVKARREMKEGDAGEEVNHASTETATPAPSTQTAHSDDAKGADVDDSEPRISEKRRQAIAQSRKIKVPKDLLRSFKRAVHEFGMIKTGGCQQQPCPALCPFFDFSLLCPDRRPRGSGRFGRKRLLVPAASAAFL